MFVKMRSIAIAAAVVSGFAASQNLLEASSCSSSVVAYQAQGRFGANVISGPDDFQLAGEPFSITLYACEAKTPTKTGSDYSTYTGIVLKGSVQSRLLTTPYPISTDKTTVTLVQPPTGLDTIQVSGTVIIQGATIFIKGNIALPAGTLTSDTISTFPTTSIVTSKSLFTYSRPAWRPSTAYTLGDEVLDPAGNAQKVMTAGTSGATAPAWNETLGGATNDNTVVWSCQGSHPATNLSVIGNASASIYAGASAKVSPFLHDGAVHVVTAHADGTQSVRPLRLAPVDPGASAASDRVMLQFYASGVRDASDVHVQIAGQEVPVLFFGAAGHFPGLDEVTVEVPRSFAGMGDVNVVLTADGQTASPVRLHIQ